MDLESLALKRYLTKKGPKALEQLQAKSKEQDKSLIDVFHELYSEHNQYDKILSGIKEEKRLLKKDPREARTLAGKPKQIDEQDYKKTVTSKKRIPENAPTIQKEDNNATIASKKSIKKEDETLTIQSRKPKSITGKKTQEPLPIPKTVEDETATIASKKSIKKEDDSVTINSKAKISEDKTATINNRVKDNLYASEEKPEEEKDNHATMPSQKRKPARDSVQRKLDELGDMFAEPEEKTTEIKTKLEDLFEIGSKIGKGGMGEVISGTQKNLERTVALKKLTQKFNPELIKRFLLEAKITAQLDHPAIPPVHDLLSEELTFIMKYVQGETLSSVIEKRKNKQHTYTENEILRLFIKACEGTAYAHAKGVIHRDLKPENIMVGKFGEVYVMDWGLAKAKGQPDITGHSVIPQKDGEKLTMVGDIMGTPLYMAPEQAAGELEQIDSLSDQYSLGASLYELITLEEPFSTSGTPENLLYRVMKGNIKQIKKKISPELKSIILKAMSTDKKERYESVTEFMTDIQNYLEGKQVQAHKYSLVEKIQRAYKKHSKKILAIAGGLFLTATAGAAYSNLQTRAIEAEAGKAKAEAKAEKAKTKAAKEKEKTAQAEAKAEKERAKTLAKQKQRQKQKKQKQQKQKQKSLKKKKKKQIWRLN